MAAHAIIRHFFLLSIFSLSIHMAYSQTVDSLAIDGELFIKVTDDASVELDPYDFSITSLNTIIALYGIDSIVKPFPGVNSTLDKTYKVYFSSILDVDILINSLELLAFIEYAEKNYYMWNNETPNDMDAAQYALQKVNAELAWDISTGSADIVVAVIDNAFLASHEDLSGNLWVNTSEANGISGLDDDFNTWTDDVSGYDVADGDPIVDPPSGIDNASFWNHGSHVAGIVSAKTNNGLGIASLGYNLKLMPLKSTRNNDPFNGRALTHTLEGIYYAIQNGAHVINMSFGSSQNATTYQNMISAAYDNNIVLVGAAGNENSQQKNYPAAYNEVISVASTNELDQKSSFSNYGNWVDVSAPGSSILSCLGSSADSYGVLSGTSMASPFVAALCGLILSHESSLTVDQVKQRITDNTDNIELINITYAGKLGDGRINAYKSLGGSIEDTTTTGMSRLPSSEKFYIYPNPGNTFLLEKTDLDMYDFIVIRNSVGKVIRKVDAENTVIREAIDEIPSGVYFISLEVLNRQKIKTGIWIKSD